MHKRSKRCISGATASLRADRAARPGGAPRGRIAGILRQNTRYRADFACSLPRRNARRIRATHGGILRYNTDARRNAPVAQWIEQRTSNPSVAGSSPAGRAIFRLRCRFAQLPSNTPLNKKLYSIAYFSLYHNRKFVGSYRVMTNARLFPTGCGELSTDWQQPSESARPVRSLA